jgi:glucose-1-phosphate thymidylyltransferase
MKAVLLAGGKGTRLWPITQGLNKHFLPIYDKPMIYYSLSTIMLAGIRDVLLVCDPESLDQYKALLKDGSQWGMQIDYKVQLEPDGIPSGLVLAKDYLRGAKVLFILGDNLLVGNFAGRYFRTFTEQSGAMIFTKTVSDPSGFGIVTYGKNHEIITIEEKPISPTSNHAITGIYFLDETASERASNLQKSARGEYEMVDVLNSYRGELKLSATSLPIGTVWLDTGSISGLSEASEYVQIVQNRQSIIIASPEAIALRNLWINIDQFNTLIERMPNSHYKSFLIATATTDQLEQANGHNE